MFNIKLGKFLAKLRKEKDITQEQLADILHIDKRKISRWECGNSIPEFELLIKLQDIFDITLYELSICQRIEDETILEKAKTKIRSIKDLKRLNKKRKCLLASSIIIGIILGISLIFTIDTYNRVEIYSLKSNDENFDISGTYTNTKNYNALEIVSITNLNTISNAYNIEISDINYEILDSKNNNRLFFFNNINKNGKKKMNLQQEIDKTSFVINNISRFVNEYNTLIFRIKWIDTKKKENHIDFKFKLIPKYKSNFLYFFLF